MLAPCDLCFHLSAYLYRRCHGLSACRHSWSAVSWPCYHLCTSSALQYYDLCVLHCTAGAMAQVLAATRGLLASGPAHGGEGAGGVQQQLRQRLDQEAGGNAR